MVAMRSCESLVRHSTIKGSFRAAFGVRITSHFTQNPQINLKFSIKDLYIPNFCCTFAAINISLKGTIPKGRDGRNTKERPQKCDRKAQYRRGEKSTIHKETEKKNGKRNEDI